MDKIKPEIAGNKTIFVDADYMGKMIAPAASAMKLAKHMATAYNTFKKGK
jgi:putrescine transport system substrate-binding protein